MAVADHEHVLVEEKEPSNRLILGWCLECGIPALDVLERLKAERDSALGLRQVAVRGRGEYDEELDDWAPTAPFLVPDRLVYHWAPSARRRQIIRYGLRPKMRPSLNIEWRAPYVCFADSPSWAWALSGQMNWAPEGEWDLWQTWLSDLGPGLEVIRDDSRQSGLYEVRTPNRVFKRHLWHVGSRTKEGK